MSFLKICGVINTSQPDILTHDKYETLGFFANAGASRSPDKMLFISDGLLLFPDDKKIAIEVELSMKGKSRLDNIFRCYSGQFDINEIWYFCSPEVLPKMKKATEKKSYIKIQALG